MDYGTTTPKATAKLPNLPPLTDRQADVLVIIHDYAENDPLKRSPTLKSIAAKIGIGKSTVFVHVDRLQFHKCIEPGNPGQVHGLTVTALGKRAVIAYKGEPDTNATRTQD